MTRHFSQIFLTELRTFILSLFLIKILVRFVRQPDIGELTNKAKRVREVRFYVATSYKINNTEL
jgi:hypothetical protein